MGTSESERPLIFGGVFGFTENLDQEPGAPSLRPPAKKKKEEEPLAASPLNVAVLKNQAGHEARKRRKNSRQRGLPRELRVTEEHLKSFASLHALLQNFQDPFASGRVLQRHIDEIPVLAQRLLRTARIKTGHMHLTDVGAALSLLGNKILEQELLLLLEDLTEIKADALEKGEKE